MVQDLRAQHPSTPKLPAEPVPAPVEPAPEPPTFSAVSEREPGEGVDPAEAADARASATGWITPGREAIPVFMPDPGCAPVVRQSRNGPCDESYSDWAS
jgi:hypothetical protein